MREVDETSQKDVGVVLEGPHVSHFCEDWMVVCDPFSHCVTNCDVQHMEAHSFTSYEARSSYSSQLLC